MTHICLNFLPFAHHPFRFLLKDVLTYGQEEIRIKFPTLQFVDLLHHLTYNSCAAQVSFLPPPSSLSPCSLLCPSFSAAVQHHLSRTPWSQRFLLLQSLPGGLRVQVAQVARRPSMHQGWRRRKTRTWWLVWRNGEKAMMKRSPRLVLGSDVDAGDLKEQIKRRLQKDCYTLMTGIVKFWAKTINCSYERQNKKCLLILIEEISHVWSYIHSTFWCILYSIEVPGYRVQKKLNMFKK